MMITDRRPPAIVGAPANPRQARRRTRERSRRAGTSGSDADLEVGATKSAAPHRACRRGTDRFAIKSQFNIIHPESGLKIDVIVPEPSAFNQSRFARARVLKPQDDVEAYFASPEDAIIKEKDLR